VAHLKVTPAEECKNRATRLAGPRVPDGRVFRFGGTFWGIPTRPNAPEWCEPSRRMGD